MNIGVRNFKLQNYATQKRDYKENSCKVSDNESLNSCFKVSDEGRIGSFLPEDILNNFSKLTPVNNFDYLSKKSIPNGHSKYEYNGSRLDVFRHDDQYKSQFVHPKDFSRDDFNKHFPDLEPVTHHFDENTNSNSIDSVNGEIDEASLQGDTGDCWLIASLYSMASTEKGKEIIKNSITVNDDSSVTVAFNGLGVSYNITNNELSRHDTDNNQSDSYVNGDNDILAVELAVEKLWKDIDSGRVVLNTENEDLLYTGEGNGIADGGLPNQLVYYLTGIESEEYYNEDLSNLSKNEIYEILNNAYKNKNSTLSIGVYGNMHSATLTDGTTYELDTQGGGHALAITDVQEDTLTFVNPWDTSVEYKMSWEEFTSLGIGYISYANLDDAIIADEIVDMTDESNSENNYSNDRGFIIPNNDFNPERFSPDRHFEPNNYSNEGNFEYGNNFGIPSIMDFLESLIDLFKSFAK